ncbi:hypothetical protein L3Q82_024671 [Scortum barcoo]|uniref:Uncharacterized protein n=1 Tax=Scortum barcoo TaxID=214431 RepID=A0ACB8WQJ7_9TELE|nr:hypothetical protein L3Q82_024671 [Scortum barcoo]
MKTLCVAVVVLSLSSVCQPAPLDCEKLLKPLDSNTDLSGTWYFIAFSSGNCLVPLLLNFIFLPSVKVDITPRDKPNIYNATFNIKVSGYCENETSPFIYVNSSAFDIDPNNVPTGGPSELLQSGCSDCLVVKDTDVINIFGFFSKRQTVTAAELREFETQAECLGWSKPQVFDTDHGEKIDVHAE